LENKRGAEQGYTSTFINAPPLSYGSAGGALTESCDQISVYRYRRECSKFCVTTHDFQFAVSGSGSWCRLREWAPQYARRRSRHQV